MTSNEVTLNLDAVVATLKDQGYNIFPPEANICNAQLLCKDKGRGNVNSSRAPLSTVVATK